MMRLGLAALTVFHLVWGIPAMLAPRWFFDTFPGVFGQHWTAAYPPYNEHLMTDVGVAATTLGVLLGCALVLADAKVTRVVLLGVITFSSLHLIFHLVRHGSMAGFWLWTSWASLALGVIVPCVLLVHSRREYRA